MANPPCSVCVSDPAIPVPNAGVLLMTDLDDGTSICACPIHLDDIAEYVVSMMQAFDEAVALMNDAGEVELGQPPASETPSELADAAEAATAGVKATGRSRSRSDDPPTAIDVDATAEPNDTPAVASSPSDQ